MKKILLLIVSLIMVFTMAAMTSCGENDKNTASDDGNGAGGADVTVTIDIDYPDKSGKTDVEDANVTVPENSSVLDVLNQYAKDNKIEIVMDDSSDMPYVYSIDGVSATKTAGWVYEVNDEMIMETADKHIVKSKDSVEWSFEDWNNDDSDDDD